MNNYDNCSDNCCNDSKVLCIPKLLSDKAQHASDWVTKKDDNPCVAILADIETSPNPITKPRRKVSLKDAICEMVRNPEQHAWTEEGNEVRMEYGVCFQMKNSYNWCNASPEFIDSLYLDLPETKPVIATSKKESENLELPEGYEDKSEGDEIYILDPNETIMCSIQHTNDLQAIRYAIKKWEEYCTTQAQGLYSVTALLFKNYQALGSYVLSVSRKNNHADIGLPGGKIDPGETPEQALVRELKEETGVTALRFVPVFDDFCRLENGERRPARTYLVYSWEGDPKCIENAIVDWVLPEKLFDPTNTFHKYNINLFNHLSAIQHINNV